jgi:alkanesulfonate monooxygenase SsuD/methylene tetrahydromethanopterin reductase-like flavin-dependent oxidoreductase (luciferase family)
MKIGVVLPTIEDPSQGRAPSYNEVREMALMVEQAGFDSLWLFDHLLYRRWEAAPRAWRVGGLDAPGGVS